MVTGTGESDLDHHLLSGHQLTPQDREAVSKLLVQTQWVYRTSARAKFLE